MRKSSSSSCLNVFKNASKDIQKQFIDIVGSISKGGVLLFENSQVFKALLEKTGTIILDVTTEEMLRADKAFMEAFRYHFGSNLSNNCLVSKVRKGKHIEISDFTLFNKCINDEACILYYEKEIGESPSAADLVILKKQRKRLISFVNRNMSLVIDYFDLHVVPKTIEKKRSLSQESMQRAAGEKLAALEGKNRPAPFFHPVLTSEQRLATDEEENQLMFLEATSSTCHPNENRHERDASAAKAMEPDGLVDSDDEDVGAETASVLSSLDEDGERVKVRHIDVSKMTLYTLFRKVPEVELGIWMRLNFEANSVEFALMHEDPDDSVIRTVDTVFKSPVNWNKKSVPSSVFLDLEASVSSNV